MTETPAVFKPDDWRDEIHRTETVGVLSSAVLPVIIVIVYVGRILLR